MKQEIYTRDQVYRLLNNVITVIQKGRKSEATEEEKAAAQKLLYGGTDSDFDSFLDALMNKNFQTGE